MNRASRSFDSGSTQGLSLKHLLALLIVMAGFACGGDSSGRAPSTDASPSSHECTACHGQGADPMPPRAVDGTTSSESIGVGAHAAHVRGSGNARPVPCSECHVVPQVVGAADGGQHPDPLGGPAPVVFGLVASNDSASPSWDRGTQTCADVFCHGSTLRGAKTRPLPVWTRVDGSQRKCDSCHGYPPPLRHLQRLDCETCHWKVVAADGVIINPLLHVNGRMEVDMSITP